jgi:hypothetical protein
VRHPFSHMFFRAPGPAMESVLDPSARIICACSAAFRALFLCALTHLSFLRIFQVSISYWENSTRSCESVAYHFRMYVPSASLFFIFSAARLVFSGLDLTTCSFMRDLVMMRQTSRVSTMQAL